jgi:hypothetical protein
MLVPASHGKVSYVYKMLVPASHGKVSYVYKMLVPASHGKRKLRQFDADEMIILHLTTQINQPKRCNTCSSLLLDVYVWLNMFRAPFRQSSGAYNCTRSLWFYRWSVVAGALLVVVWQTTANNAPTVKLEAPSAVVGS